ncbi:MAG: LacI family transcriptional regulator [Friedmanniella sp.]|jgi:DNA-binding LacI/PurR family transcriptional regulator|nr:LacI family transcriptional regulator [Friedmanniella sp.]
MGTGSTGEDAGRDLGSPTADRGGATLPEDLLPVVAPRPIADVEPTIYDVARVAGVAASTVSRALSKPGRVSFKTAERVRQVAEDLGYRSGRLERVVSTRGSGMLAMIVADIANPVFFGMIRGAERTATENGFTLLVVETQESEQTEQDAATRLATVADGTILGSSRLSDAAIRALAKDKPLVLLNRTVGEVASVMSDNVQAIKKATEYLIGLGHTSICYLAGPVASWADGMRWRGLREAGLELDLHVRRLGPFLPTIRGGAAAAEAWLPRPSTAVIAYNDLMAIGFMQAVTAAGRRVPADVSVVGFDNIVDAVLVEPHLSTIAAPLVSIGSTAVAHLLRSHSALPAAYRQPVMLPAKLIVRDSTGPRRP